MRYCVIGLIVFISYGISAQEQVCAGVEFKKKSSLDIVTGGHVAFPSMIHLPNDSIMMIYRRGSGHVEPSGKIMRVYGNKDGTSWGAPQTLIDTPGIDDRDPSLTLLSDGRIMLSYYTYIPVNNTTSPVTPPIYSIHVAFSNDNGHTFSTPACIDNNNMTSLPLGTTFASNKYTLPDGSIFKTFATSSPAIETNGKIIIPAYGGDAVVWSSTPGLTLSAPNALWFFESFDGGLTWNKFPVGEDYLSYSWRTEPKLCQLNNGNFLLHYRCADSSNNPMSHGPMRQAFLDQTMSNFIPDMDFNFTGHAPDILKMSNGILISAFRHVNSPSSQDVAFVYSVDHGFTWSDTVKVQTGTVESGYPTLLELNPNTLLIAYYLSGGSRIRLTTYNLNIKHVLPPPNFELPNFDEVLSLNDYENYFNVYPNPASSELNIQFKYFGEVSFLIELYDVTGKILLNDEFVLSAYGNNSFDIADLPSGIYYLRIRRGDFQMTEKIIKQ